MKGLILAAGRGSRMGALTEAGPKCLTRLGSRTLLDRQIAALRQGGCDAIGIVTGYRSETMAGRGDETFHNAHWATTNMVASLTEARAWLANEPVIVSYSDIFYSAETITRLAAARGALAISYDPNWYHLWAARRDDPLSDAETFRLDLQSNLIEIGARAESREEIEGQYMGLLRFTPPAWSMVESVVGALAPERRNRLDMTSLLALLVADSVQICAVACEGVWGECDTASDLALYESWISSGRLED